VAPAAVPDPDPAADGGLPHRVAGPVLVVRSTTARRRRAGIEFGREPVEVSTALLTEEQIEQILADPMLVVEAREEGPAS
jgi:hypothetical protein